MTVQIKFFFDSNKHLWKAQKLVGKPAGFFFSMSTPDYVQKQPCKDIFGCGMRKDIKFITWAQWQMNHWE